MNFIAEVSSNHHRDLDRACALIDAAAEVGCQTVKFQLFKIDQLFAPEILERSEDHRKRKEWELPIEFLPKLAARCHKDGVEFACTPFYLDAVGELEPYVDFYKVASYELLWNDLLTACAKTGKPVVLSTGMATISEVQHAVTILKDSGCPSPTLLHCTSAYPTHYAESNLAAIDTLRQATGCDVGWSDHTAESAVIYRAIHRWEARIIEFHLDLDGQGEEYATGHCWLPQQIGVVIRNISKGFVADGTSVKSPTASELLDRPWRADPSDGLRPSQEIRADWHPCK